MKHPDLEYIRHNSNNEKCVKFGQNVRHALFIHLVNHIISAIACFLFETVKEPLGSMLLSIRISEMLGIILNTGSNIFGITLIFKYFARQNKSDIDCYKIQNYEQQLGMSIAWLVIEFLVCTTFLATMLVCLVKSFLGMDMAADNSKMFRPRYLTFMINRLCESLI